MKERLNLGRGVLVEEATIDLFLALLEWASFHADEWASTRCTRLGECQHSDINRCTLSSLQNFLEDARGAP